ncbi:MAG: ATP-grasp domain-containing protein [Sporolactobacillus sp.]|jgi:predicted ATP-grasp superfamily ATP-dependent carboligase|nr:ATP-grasp domain-containing protein [Sporolactobacillus sp.]
MKVIVLSFLKPLTKCVIFSLIREKQHFSLIGDEDTIYAASGSKFCDAYYKIESSDDTQNVPKILDLIRSEISHTEKNFIIPACMRSTLFVSKYVKEIDGVKNFFPLCNEDTLNLLDNKWTFYLFLEKKNIPTPKTVLIHKGFTGIPFDFPVVTKPLDQQNGIDVIVSNNQSELTEVVKSAKTPILVQEFAGGTDYNLGLFCKDGTVQAWTLEKYNDHIGKIYERNDRILKIGQRIAEALHLNGIIHLDIRLNEKNGSIAVIECNPRVWASMYHSLFVGVDFIGLALSRSQQKQLKDRMKGLSYSLTKTALIKKIFSFSLRAKDIHLLIDRAKYIFSDPEYFLRYHKRI